MYAIPSSRDIDEMLGLDSRIPADFRQRQVFDAATRWRQTKKKHRDRSQVLDFLLPNSVVGRDRFELSTYGLRVRCSTS